ncbi:glycerophosphodiester phosphodiesterase family protein [Streptomyces sp. 8N706]|uniref:glycerophosphodiester phosphodiesterase family protein n=1 Tax=Streptomyces sp. 8N706 TaxID=3457416 RepID=UPI003FD25A75
MSLSVYAVTFDGLAARPAAVNQLKAAGVDVFVWTINSAWKTATFWGVDGVITNRPDAYLQWRQFHCVEK